MNRLTSTLTMAAAMAAVAATATPAEAIKYMNIGAAVKRFIPKDAKIMKVTKKPSGAQRSRLAEDYGWKAEDDKYIFYVGKREGEAVAYVYVVPEIFNTCFHKYAVGMSATGKVLETVIVELSCPRAFPVNKKSFLSQFESKSHSDALSIHSDIDAVTGATLSSVATTSAARKAVSLHNVFFAKGKRVAVSAKVKAARASGNALIKKAIETGETLKKAGKGDGSAQLE